VAGAAAAAAPTMAAATVAAPTTAPAVTQTTVAAPTTMAADHPQDPPSPIYTLPPPSIPPLP
jgi:hypothetical protein